MWHIVMAHQASPDTSSPDTDTADTADTWHRWVEEVAIIRTQHQVSPQQGLYKRGRPVSRIRCLKLVLYTYITLRKCQALLGALDRSAKWMWSWLLQPFVLLYYNLFCRVDNLVTSIWSPSVDSGHVMLDTHSRYLDTCHVMNINIQKKKDKYLNDIFLLLRKKPKTSTHFSQSLTRRRFCGRRWSVVTCRVGASHGGSTSNSWHAARVWWHQARAELCYRRICK